MIQRHAAVRDIAARIAGAGALEGVPDEFVRAGDVVLVDLPPEALRRRIASGQLYSADGVGGALADYFRPSNLAALSDLAKAWLEGTVDGRSRIRRRAPDVEVDEVRASSSPA